MWPNLQHIQLHYAAHKIRVSQPAFRIRDLIHTTRGKTGFYLFRSGDQ